MKIWYEKGQVQNDNAMAFPVLAEIKDGKLPEDVCVALGGHCYVTDSSVLASYPPTYVRRCKHCGHTQYGRPQDDISWSDK